MNNNEKKFTGEGKAYTYDGEIVLEESYKLEAIRKYCHEAKYQFIEQKTYPDGLKRETIFVIDSDGRPYNYSDQFKSVKGFYPKEGLNIGFQKWTGFCGFFLVSFDEYKLETITFSENRVYLETLSSIP